MLPQRKVNVGGSFNTSRFTSTLEIANALRSHIEELKLRVESNERNKNVIWLIGVEDFLKTFGFQSFNTRGIFALARLNAVVTYISSQVFQVVPYSIHPTVPRAIYGLKAEVSSKRARELKKQEAQSQTPTTTTTAANAATQPKVSKQKVIKEIVLQFIKQRLPENYALRMNRKGQLESSNYDQADAFLLALATLYKRREDELLQSNEEFIFFQDAFVAQHKLQTESSLSSSNAAALLKLAPANLVVDATFMREVFSAAVRSLPPP